MRYESIALALGQRLAAAAKNGKLELPDAGEYTAKDYAIAVEAYLTWMLIHAINSLTNGEPGELRNMAKYLMRHCDMSHCDSPALPDDIFCANHRAVEDLMISDSLAIDPDFPF